MSDLGNCPRCARPFTAAEVAGYGILRSRSARAGGPLMLLPCQGCGNQLRLIPHGDGRYALPGQPPPAAVPEAQRRPPWMKDAPPASEPHQERVQVEDPRPPPRPPEPEETVEPPPAPDVEDESTLTVVDALAILGVETGASASEIEKAFHRRSKTCHPDKVAHLDPEFQELAERKFRLLKASFDLLRS